MNQLNKSGFAKILQEVKDKKVYVGSSAGSIVSSKAFPAGGELFSDSKSVDWPDTKESLGWLDAYPVPHYKGEDFPERTDEWLDERSDNLGFKVFALGDGSALKVIDDAVEVVGEGPWKMI